MFSMLFSFRFSWDSTPTPAHEWGEHSMEKLFSVQLTGVFRSFGHTRNHTLPNPIGHFGGEKTLFSTSAHNPLVVLYTHRIRLEFGRNSFSGDKL